jgi:hypothetical protein
MIPTVISTSAEANPTTLRVMAVTPFVMEQQGQACARGLRGRAILDRSINDVNTAVIR